MDGWYIGNIVFGGLLGILIVDPATGSMWKLPANHTVNLSPDSARNGIRSLEIIDISTLSEEQKSALIALD